MPRPPVLNPLFRSLTSIKGVGPQIAGLVRRLVGTPEGQDPVLLDLMFHMPVGTIDRRIGRGIAGAEVGSVATLLVHVDEHVVPPRGSRAPLRVRVHDETGEMVLVFFGARGNWVEKTLPVGAQRLVSGEIGFFAGTRQITHPDYIVSAEEADTLPRIEPVYPLTQGLSAKALRKMVATGLDSIPVIPEWIPAARVKSGLWPDFSEALHRIHRPHHPGEGDSVAPARQRLAYDELLAAQLALAIVRATLTRERGVPRRLTGTLTAAVTAALPFSLTAGQIEARDQILADLTSERRMVRLVQGDVGSGKTVLALLAMAAMAESGAQSALMAPTELLAAQHFRTLAPLAQAAGLSIVLLTGKMAAAARRAAETGLADGSIQIAVGTHALFQGSVAFADLGLTVVDEQHRFGVHQRLALSGKGKRTDLLVMTATPIPRTLVLANFGDMDVSVLREKPAGRQPIDTAALPNTRYDRVVDRLAARIEEGAQAYWVCPLVEESDTLDVVSAEDRYKALQARFGDRVALVHGRLGNADKQAAMDRFQSGDARILVATTVIEVGVDVPNATIIVIEHAERFGLAQLHQLRGRVGRGSARSACLLLHEEKLSETARARIETLVRTDDGFEIAEEDLRLRGHGDVLGTRQSGMPGYRIAIPDLHGDLLELAHGDARKMLAENPELKGPQGEAIRSLLYLFRKDLAIPLIGAG